jgi:hypothetical protein
MKNLNGKRFGLAIFFVFAMCFVIVAAVEGFNISGLWSALRTAYKTVPLVVAVSGFFIAYAWRWPLFRGWLVPFPDLNGSWRGHLQTTWSDPTTGKVPGPIPVLLTVKQSFVRISCVMRTAEMTSQSFLADFWIDDNEQIRKLGYCYNSLPGPDVRHRSAPHQGTAILEIMGKSAKRLKGHYWSDRKTTGQITLEFFNKKRLEEDPSLQMPHPMSGS